MTGTIQPSPSTSGPRQVAFICGCGHSGTTLLATMLAAHPEVHVPLYESGAFLAPEEGRVTGLDELIGAAVAAGKPLLVEKTPRHVRKMEDIRGAVPGARFLLLVRDGRDVTASIARRLHGNFAAGLERWLADTGIVYAERNSHDVLVIRYEDLILRTPAELWRTCAFLGIEYSGGLLRYFERPKLWFGKSAIRRPTAISAEHEDLRNWQVNQPIFDGRGRWKDELPLAVRLQFQRGAPRALLRAFGYARSWWD